MKIENKYVVEYRDGFVISVVRGEGSLYSAKGNEVKQFKTEAELDEFILSNNLKEQSEDSI